MRPDLLIHGGTVADGSGKPAFQADVLVTNGRIADVGRVPSVAGASIIDARGKVVCPGFIDLHSHAEFVLPRPDHPLVLEPFIRQGITTVVAGNCGYTPAPLHDHMLQTFARQNRVLAGGELAWNWHTMNEFLAILERQGVALNVALLVGHGTLRAHVIGGDSRLARPDELQAMRLLLRESLEAGTLGLSFGLAYWPGLYADTDELVALAEEVHSQNGFCAAHVRGDDDLFLHSVKELLEVSARSRAAMHHSHFGVRGPAHWPKAHDGLSLYDKARSAGQDVTADLIPYVGGNGYLGSIFPAWALEGGKLEERLLQPALRARMKWEVENYVPAWPPWLEGRSPQNHVRTCGWGNIWIRWVASERNKSIEGLTFEEIARQRGVNPFDAAADLLAEEHGAVMIVKIGIGGSVSREDLILEVLSQSYVSVVTDAILTGGGGKPFTAGYGATAKLLGRFARDEGRLSLEDAVRRLTSLPAERAGLRGRGVLQPGAHADIVVFDPLTIRENGTFVDPCRYPDGIEYVLINGRVVKDPEGCRPQLLAGEVIRRTRP